MDANIVLGYLISSIMILVGIAWISLIYGILQYISKAPSLDKFENNFKGTPLVSVIIPARNETENIARCLDSMLEQDYPNYEVLVINDSSEDDTGDIIKEYSKRSKKIIHIDADAKPDGWVGKNWACMEGVRIAKSDLLLFTDADTRHARNVITLTVNHLESKGLDALTALPRMRTRDFLTKITMPIISVFLHTRFSALQVNNPKKKMAYFVGGFFIIRRHVYEAVGMHEGVRSEIVEDGALGRKVKDAGYKLLMVKGEHLIDALWARDPPTLWNALKRIMIPMYLQTPKLAIGLAVGLVFLLFLPFPLFIYGIVSFQPEPVKFIMLLSSAFALICAYIGVALETTKGMNIHIKYVIFEPLGSLIVVGGLIAGILKAKKRSSVSWRGRTYDMRKYEQQGISI